MSNGKAFSLVSTYQPAIANEASVAYKTEMAVIPLYDAFTTSSFTAGFYWAVARNSEQPEKRSKCWIISMEIRKRQTF